ncbi:MAG: cation diffusion facilitator family transporter, partial [Ruminococcus callidus]
MNENNKMNAMLDKSTDEFIDFDKLEAQLEDELEDQMSDLQFLESEREQIGNPDSLGKTIKNVVWEQFLNQVAVTAGEDFIKENNGLT